MMARVLVFLFLLPFLAGGGDKEGRRGNEFYAQQQYELAIEAYERGLASLSEEAPRLLRYGLLNNLGAALLESGDAQGAGEAFTRALNAAPAPADVARTSYNAGNASFATEDLQTALAHYRQSLLADPTNQDAKFNYEFVKRRLQQQQEQQQDQQQDGDQQNQEQQGDQQQQGGDQNQEQDQQEQDQQDGGSQQEQQESPSEQEEEQEQPGQQQPSPDELSNEQAERILQALQNEEEQLLRQVQRPKSRPRQVEKDW